MREADQTNVGTLKRSPIGPIDWVLRFFSSIWLGVILLTILFVYGSVGSAGFWIPGQFTFTNHHNWIHDIYWFIPWTQMHIRQAPGLEMTEFEWFHWWPFNLLILLICINLVVATVRRIPLNIINLGVWMIHSGIIILAIGSVMYFATKLEGDAPIVRRQVIIDVPGHEPVSLVAMPGNEKSFRTADGRQYRFRVFNIDPDWELLTGEAAGNRTFAVTVAVQTHQDQFLRQLLVGYPELTEDTLWTGNPEQPMVRAINEIGRRLVDDSISMQLAYAPQDSFYLMDSAAIYLREKGSTEWIQRPIRNLPRYNEYVHDPDDVWTDPDSPPLVPRPLELAVDAHEPNDPLGDVPFYVTHYLRYAFMETRRSPMGDRIDPVAIVRLRSDAGVVEEHNLVAFDPSRNLVAGGRLHFKWVDSPEAFERATDVRPPRLTIRVPENDVEVSVVAVAGESFTPIEGTDFAYRVESLEDLGLTDEETVSLAIVRIRTPERTFRRWVFHGTEFDDRDLRVDGDHMSMHDQELEFDSRIEMTYEPGRRPVPVTLIAGPDENDLHLLLAVSLQNPTLQRLRPGQEVRLQRDISMTVLSYAARTTQHRRPTVVPLHQREPNDRQQRSIIKVHLPVDGGRSVWLPYHLYPFRDRTEVMRRFPFQPTEVELPGGRVIEMMFSRERRALPAPVALHDFILTTHIGGFTGQTTSIRDWTSIVRFRTDDDWTDTMPISMNKPTSFGGFWYFQAQWDPPDPQPRFEGDVPSRGLNYTVLGVGNRNGVWTQLAGCIISVVGMLYAFYVKPLLKRRRQEAVYADVLARKEQVRSDIAPQRDHANDSQMERQS